MSWITIAFSAAVGASAALITFLLVPSSKERRLAYGLVFAIIFVVLNGLGREHVLPHIHNHFAAANAEKELLEIPAYRVMKQQYPSEYAAILAGMEEGLRQGQSQLQLSSNARSHFVPLLEARLPHASDSAIVAYIGIMIEEMRTLNNADPTLCMKFLFPQIHGQLNIQEHIPPELLRRDLSALATIIETSAGMALNIPGEAEIAQDRETVLVALVDLHGENTQVLQNLQSPTVEKALACTITADLYSEVIKLPVTRAAQLIRYLFT